MITDKDTREQILYNECVYKKDNDASLDDDTLDDSLLPRLWGPSMWKSLHSISFGYPKNPTKDDMVHYKMFFEMISYILPCKDCRISYAQFIKTGETKMTDEVFESRKSLTFWLYKIHEAVNKKLGVSYNVTYEDIVSLYESHRAKCNHKDNKCLTPPHSPTTQRTETSSMLSSQKIKKYKFQFDVLQ